MKSDRPNLLQAEHIGLKTAIGARPLLSDISFSVQAGEIVAIAGPSGAGKTSLLRLLNRLSELSEGKIYLEGSEIRDIPVLQLRQRVGLVLQESKLLGMAVKDAIAYPLKLRNCDRQTTDQQFLAWAEKLRIPEDWWNRTEAQLSVGQRQRVAIARTLITQPQLLLLDEPTAAQDAGSASHLLEIFRDLATQQNMAILMVNHQLEWAKVGSDRLLYLKQGKLIHDLPSPQVDWSQIQTDLIETERQEAESWE